MVCSHSASGMLDVSGLALPLCGVEATQLNLQIRVIPYRLTSRSCLMSITSERAECHRVTGMPAVFDVCELPCESVATRCHRDRYSPELHPEWTTSQCKRVAVGFIRLAIVDQQLRPTR
jgi:hypothetical protein